MNGPNVHVTHPKKKLKPGPRARPGQHISLNLEGGGGGGGTGLKGELVDLND